MSDLTLQTRLQAQVNRCAKYFAFVTEREQRAKLKFRLRVLSLLPPLVSFAILFLFAGVPQMREVYLGIIESNDIVEVGRGVLGLVLLIVLCTMLYVWHYWMGTRSLNNLYPEHADLRFDTTLMSWRNNKALFCAAMPMIGLIIGLALLLYEANGVAGRFSSTVSYFEQISPAATKDAVGNTKNYVNTLPLFIGLVMFVVICVLFTMHVVMRRDTIGHQIRTAVAWTGFSVCIGIAILPLLVPDLVVPVTRFIGPMGGIALVLIAIVSLLTGISWSVKQGDPAVSKGIAAIAAIIMGFYLLYEGLRYETVPPTEENVTRQNPTGDDLKQKFQAWLKARADRAAYGSKPYPVFVVAAQGGGIYASSAAAAFLASMQDRCDNFAQHVFAVSGVSGGAVGTAVFTGLIDDWQKKQAKQQSPTPCRQSASKAFESATEKIMLADHLSPVVALIAPDLIRKTRITDWIRPEFDRSNALERSFACSFDQNALTPQSRPGMIPWCGTTADGTGVRMSQADYWQPTGASPALILNSTWAEVGYRVAFSPFRLRAIGDGTLYSFSELPLEKDQVPKSLIEAAFVSARFPGIVPARSIGADPANPEFRYATSPPLWNFVDGGYIDNSGSTTALEIYKFILEKIPKSENIDLRLVLLTDADARLDFKNIKGSRADDTVTPITALFSVRGQLSRRAVTRAIETVHAIETAEPLVKDRPLLGLSRGDVAQRNQVAPDTRILFVDVEQQTFKLPLGWKISKVTNDIVRLMMGRPELCPPEKRQFAVKPDIENIVQSVEQNSCVKRRMISLLEAK